MSLKYVMNKLELDLLDYIKDHGYKNTIQILTRVCTEYGHELSDLGLKEQAIQAMKISDSLKEVQKNVEE